MYGMCRVCLNDSHSYSHIFQNLLGGNPLYDVLNDVCQLDVKVGDGLPEFLCLECHEKLAEFDSFKRKSHLGSAALQRLRNDIGNSPVATVKMEVEDPLPEEIKHLEVYIKSEMDSEEDGLLAEETQNSASPLEEDDLPFPIPFASPTAAATSSRGEPGLESTIEKIRSSWESIQRLRMDGLMRAISLEREEFESQREEEHFRMDVCRMRKEEDETVSRIRLESELENDRHRIRVDQLTKQGH